MKRIFAIILVAIASVSTWGQNPVAELVDRIDAGASKRFSFDLSDQTAEEDFFVIDTKKGKISIEGNTWVSVAAGLNWYLKYYAGVQISWNNPRQRLLDLPKPKTAERRTTTDLVRYYLNYCTASYSMAFWDEKRWQQEIDWMALHGVNLPLITVGSSMVWKNTMLRLGYSPQQVGQYIAGPAFQAWWLMNNLEGWGGVNTENYYANQAKLGRWIVDNCRKWGVEPVVVGYSGMLPSFPPADTSKFGTLTGENVGKWCGYDRPSFLQPSDARFDQVAAIYYEELEKVYGKAKYFAMDPFHEGGDVSKIDFPAAGKAIFDAMSRASEGSVWVCQAWQDNPRAAMIDALPRSGVIVLDLFSESRPQWGDMRSSWYRKDGFVGHQWVYCMLLNFGANTGMYGKMERVVNSYYLAKSSPQGVSMVGVGTTMEGIENNPVMYELLYELPWRGEQFTIDEWIENWVKARYGHVVPQTTEAWKILARTAYNPPYDSAQEGTSESVFCARPALEVKSVSSWGSTVQYYDHKEFRRALDLMWEVSDKYKGCNNFEYDLVDIARQALSNYGYQALEKIRTAFDQGDKGRFKILSSRFLKAITLMDRLLGARAEFMVGPWIESAMRMGTNDAERDWLRWNARLQITTWGNRHAANIGGLRDYAYKEWSGLMSDYYYPRWQYFFDYILQNEQLPVGFDYYDMESKWVEGTNPYPTHPTSEVDLATYEVKRFLNENE